MQSVYGLLPGRKSKEGVGDEGLEKASFLVQNDWYKFESVLNQALAFHSLKLLCMFSLSFHPLRFGRIGVRRISEAISASGNATVEVMRHDH